MNIIKPGVLFLFFILIAQNVFSQTWFECTPSGRLKQIINKDETDNYKYYAILDIENDVETTTLFKENEKFASIQKTILPDGFLLSFSQEDNLISISRYTGNVITYEELYDENELIEKREYSYSKNGFPVKVNAVDKADTPLYTEKYFYHSNNSLIQIIREYKEGNKEFIAYTYDSQGNIKQTYESYNNDSTLSYYHGNAKTDEFSWDDGAKKEVRKWETEGEFKYLVETDILSGREVRQQYNQDNLLLKTVEKKDIFLKITDYEYQDGLLAMKECRSAGSDEVWKYKYDSDNIVAYEEYLKNDILLRTTEYLGDDISVETVYRDSKPFLKITYKDGLRISQEFISEVMEQ